MKSIEQLFLSFEPLVVVTLRPQNVSVFLDWHPLARAVGLLKPKQGGAQIFLEEELNCGAHNVKERKFSLGAVNCSLEELDNAVVDAGVTIDASVLNNLDSHQHCYGRYLSGYREGRQCRPHQFFFK